MQIAARRCASTLGKSLVDPHQAADEAAAEADWVCPFAEDNACPRTLCNSRSTAVRNPVPVRTVVIQRSLPGNRGRPANCISAVPGPRRAPRRGAISKVVAVTDGIWGTPHCFRFSDFRRLVFARFARCDNLHSVISNPQSKRPHPAFSPACHGDLLGTPTCLPRRLVSA